MINSIRDFIKVSFDNKVSFNSSWCEVINNASNVSVFHLRSTVDYHIEYYSGEDLSFVLYENNRAIAVLPLFVYVKDQQWKISGDGHNLIEPLFVSKVPRKMQKRLLAKIVKLIEDISTKLKVERVEIYNSGTNLSNWYLLWLEKADRSFVTYQLTIELGLTIEDIKSRFRKSYKPLINKAYRELDIEICNNNIDYVFEEFRLLHLEVAGRETRSRKTWDIHKKQVKDKEAFLVTVRLKKQLIGAGLFTYTQNMGAYSVGVYKRELFDMPIGHGVQMKAIEKMKDIGCDSYLIGEKVTKLGISQPTQKELSISHFKEGFSGYVYAQPHISVRLSG